MSKDSLSTKLASAALAASLVVSPVGAIAGKEPSDPENNNNVSMTQEVNPLIKEGWNKAKSRSDYIKAHSANIKAGYEYSIKNNKSYSPRSLSIVNELSVFTKKPIAFNEMRSMVNEYRNIGLVGTFIGMVVVDNNDSNLSLEDVRKEAEKVRIDAEKVRLKVIETAIKASEYGGNINGVYIVHINPNELKDSGVKDGSIMVYMGNTPVFVYDNIDEASDEINTMFRIGLHTTPYKGNYGSPKINSAYKFISSDLSP